LSERLLRKMGEAKLVWIEPPPPAEGAAPRIGAPFRVWFGTVPEYSYEGKGLLLAGTSAGSPAEKAGMLAGDVVLQVGDVVVDTIHDFMYALQTYKPGDVVLTRFLRDGVEESVRVTLSTRDAQ
jgi:S1-C subfamily serine protease